MNNITNNCELVQHFMNHSATGEIAQIVVIEAIRRYRSHPPLL